MPHPSEFTEEEKLAAAFDWLRDNRSEWTDQDCRDEAACYLRSRDYYWRQNQTINLQCRLNRANLELKEAAELLEQDTWCYKMCNECDEVEGHAPDCAIAAWLLRNTPDNQKDPKA